MFSLERDPVEARMSMGFPRSAKKPRAPSMVVRSRDEQHEKRVKESL